MAYVTSPVTPRAPSRSRSLPDQTDRTYVPFRDTAMRSSSICPVYTAADGLQTDERRRGARIPAATRSTDRHAAGSMRWSL